MSLLSQVTTGRIKQPIFSLIYGVDGVGKSSLAASAPKSIFLGTEKGTSNLDVARFPTATSLKNVMQAIDELITDKHEYQTLVIDSLDWLEPLVWEQTCMDAEKKEIQHIEDFGYGKGYALAIKHWSQMVSKLSKLRDTKGMNILLIAHSQVKLAKDPQTQTEYDRYQLKLNDKSAALWREAVDAVLFMNFEVVTKTENRKTKAFGDGTRYLFTERRPGFDAKNRYGLPFQVEISAESPWDDLMRAYHESQPAGVEGLVTQINDLLQRLTEEKKADEELKTKVLISVAKANNSADVLQRIYNKLQTIAA